MKTTKHLIQKFESLLNAACPDREELAEQARQLLFSNLHFENYCRTVTLPHPGSLPYSRNLVYKSDQLEVMIARWNPEIECHPHDHGASEGCVWLLQGNFSESAYGFDGSSLRKNGKAHLAQGHIIKVKRGEIHSCLCDRDGLSVHLYWPAIRHMMVYDLQNQKSLVVSGNCGAWIPDSADMIVKTIPWKTLA